MIIPFRVLRFLTSGTIGISVNLGTLHLLVTIFDVHYLLSSIIALSISMVVGFLLQKYWTFEEHSTDRAPMQFVFYVSLALFNLSLNTGIVYVLSGVLLFHYLLAQAAGAGAVALVSYFVYREFIFKREASGGGEGE